MFHHLYQCESRRSISRIVSNGLKSHQNSLNSYRLRVDSILSVYSTFTNCEPLEEINSVSSMLEKQDALRDLPQINLSWKKWHIWANKFNTSLKSELGTFSQNVLASGALNHTRQNKNDINFILNTGYTSALWLRTSSSLVYNCTSKHERKKASSTELLNLIHRSITDFRDLSETKLGTRLDVKLSLTNFPFGSNYKLVCVESQIRYVFVEVLQNAAASLVRKHGLLKVNDMPSVLHMHASIDNECLKVEIIDDGEGMTNEEVAQATDYFATSNIGFVRDLGIDLFGMPFTGIGVGIPRAKIYLEFHGGELSLSSSKGMGTRVTMILPLVEAT